MFMRPPSSVISRRAFVASAAAGAVVAALPVRAAAPPVGVVELFTSQGCSSCPPADVALAAFASEPGILALAYHVDYWDYLGWADTLARAENTDRQRAYARTLGSRSVYTPQAVVNGRVHMNGGDRRAVERAIAAHAASGRGLAVPVSVGVSGDRLSVAVGEGAKPAGLDMLVSITFFRRRSEVEIARGENAGRTFVYANAVIAQQTLGMWDGRRMSIDLPKSKIDRHGADGCAVLLQAAIDGAPGPIAGAADLAGLKRS